MAVTANRSPLALVIFGLALLGALIVVHLHFQQQAAFAFGCTGAEAFDAEAGLSGGTAEGCAEVTSSRWATFAGVNNVVWGLLFYGLVAALRLAFGATGDPRLRLASLGVVGLGFLYTLYLVYLQVAEIGAFCVLCMASAATVTLLLILHVMEHMRSGAEAPATEKHLQPVKATNRKPALRPYLLLAGVFAVLLLADYAWAGRRAEEAADAAPTATETETPAEPVAAGETPLTPPDPSAVQCGYDPIIAPVADLERLIDGAPAEGPEGAPVTFVEVFDPNCPHCKTLWETVNDEFKEAHPQARFYMVPFPLWDFSLGQVAALRLSREEGRYDQMVSELFTRQAGRGMTLDQVVEAATAAGVNGPGIRQQLTNNATLDPLLQQILAHREFVTGAVTADGSMSVPKVVINGRVLAPDPQWGYTSECLDRLITEASGVSVEAGG